MLGDLISSRERYTRPAALALAVMGVTSPIVPSCV